MKSADFWRLVQCNCHVAPLDDDADASNAFAELDAATLLGFHARLQLELAALDTPELREVADQLWVLDVSAWLNLRAWCILQGPVFVGQVRRHPAVLRAASTTHPGPFEPPNGEPWLDGLESACVARQLAAVN